LAAEQKRLAKKDPDNPRVYDASGRMVLRPVRYEKPLPIQALDEEAKKKLEAAKAAGQVPMSPQEAAEAKAKAAAWAKLSPTQKAAALAKPPEAETFSSPLAALNSAAGIQGPDAHGNYYLPNSFDPTVKPGAKPRPKQQPHPDPFVREMQRRMYWNNIDWYMGPPGWRKAKAKEWIAFKHRRVDPKLPLPLDTWPSIVPIRIQKQGNGFVDDYVKPTDYEGTPLGKFSLGKAGEPQLPGEEPNPLSTPPTPTPGAAPAAAPAAPEGAPPAPTPSGPAPPSPAPPSPGTAPTEGAAGGAFL